MYLNYAQVCGFILLDGFYVNLNERVLNWAIEYIGTS